MRRVLLTPLAALVAVALLTLGPVVEIGSFDNAAARGSVLPFAVSGPRVVERAGGAPAPSAPGTGSNNSSVASWNYVAQASILQDPEAGTMTYDAGDGYVLWYGGDCGGYGCNQTAAFQNGSWHDIRTGVSPTAQKDAPIAYDAADGYVLLFGGWGYDCYAYSEYECNQTWEYKAGAWTQLDPRCYYLGVGFASCALPEGYFPMVYDPASGYVFLDAGTGTSRVTAAGDLGPWAYRNDTWTYLGINFTTGATISSPDADSLVYDAADGYVLAFGGAAASPSLPGNLGDNLTWEWNDNGWVNLSANVTNAPPARITTALAYDATDGYVLLYGGSTGVCDYNESLTDCDADAVQQGYSDTWAYVHGNWTELNASSAPGYVTTPLLAYDPVDRGVVDYNEFSCGNGNLSAGCTSCPCTDEATWVWGPAAPVGNVSIVARSTVDVGVPVNFSVTFDGGTPPFTFQWAFGDGQFAQGGTVAHAYASAGNFTAIVWVNDSRGYRAIASMNVAVYPGSLATAYALPDPTDVGLGTSFSPGVLNGTSGPYSFNWSFGDGEGTSYACPNPGGPTQYDTSHTYSTPGTYIVQVSISYPDGLLVNESFSLQVNADPVVSGLYASPNPAVLGQPVNFTVSVTNGTSPFAYSWNFGDGGLGGNLSAISHTYTTDGPFRATVNVTDAAGFLLTDVVSVTIALTPTVTGNTSLGATPLLASFESAVLGGVPGYTYLWQFGDGSTSAGPDPSHVYTQSGNYTAALRVTDSVGHAVWAYWPVQVFPGGGSLGLSIRASATNVMVGQTTTLTLAPSGGVGGYTVRWLSEPPDCSPPTTLSLSCTPTAGGSYSARAEVTDGRGATATASISFVATANSSPTQGGGGTGSFGLSGNDGWYLILGLAGGAVAGVGSMFVVQRRLARRRWAQRAVTARTEEPVRPSPDDPTR
jgi:PKD repeat protein